MHTMKECAVFVVQVAVLCAITAGASGCGNHNGATSNAAVADGGGTGTDDATVDAATAQESGGGASAGQTPGMFASDGGCLGLGGACANPSECCSGDCANGTCSYPSCTSDTQACTSNRDCCSQNCISGKCAPLNTSCKTIGNSCASNSECCPRRCANGTCQASSFCGQPGDACSANADCCTGTCTTAAGQTLGTCAASPPSVSANCQLADGQLCGGSGPGGNTAYEGGGLPLCGGPCCSRACAPWGPTGVLICQPASGCHVVGDLCTQDSDCCGSAGLPGGLSASSAGGCGSKTGIRPRSAAPPRMRVA